MASIGIMVSAKDAPEVREYIEHLRGLIKKAEWSAEWSESGGACPWCGAIQEQLRYGNGRPEQNTGGHAADCPAFTPSGEVR